ncbi:MAG: secondary thiamine-phosphate synthase enzyme YjbQ [Nitrososphaerota archaeon]
MNKYMRTYTSTIKIKSTNRVEMINITHKVSEILRSSEIKNGIVLLFTRHTTSALTINEDEHRLKKDIMDLLEKIVPENADYRHNEIDNNADAHLRSSLMQPFLIIPIVNGSLQLGTWQSLFFLELDGPRNREIIATIIGE